jgi:hypothetical protein
MGGVEVLSYSLRAVSLTYFGGFIMSDRNMLIIHARRCIRQILHNISLSEGYGSILVESSSTREDMEDILKHYTHKNVRKNPVCILMITLRLEGVSDYLFSKRLYDAFSPLIDHGHQGENIFAQGQLYLIGRMLEGIDDRASMVKLWGAHSFSHVIKYHYTRIKSLRLSTGA